MLRNYASLQNFILFTTSYFKEKMTQSNTLFDFSMFEKRKEIDQDDFEKNNKLLILSFIDGVNHSFEKLHTVVLKAIEPIDQEKNLCAIVMSGYLAGFFKRKHPELCIKATKQRFKLLVDKTNVYVKKLDEQTKLPSNIPTDESIKIYHQLTDTEKDKQCNIFLGYTVNEEWSMITGIYAVCIEGSQLLWISDLNNFGDETATPVLPITPNPILPKVKIGVKKIRAQNE